MLQELSAAMGGEGMARSQILDAQQYVSMACTKIQDAAGNMQGVSVHQQMLKQDRRFLVSSLPVCHYHCGTSASLPVVLIALFLHTGERLVRIARAGGFYTRHRSQRHEQLQGNCEQPPQDGQRHRVPLHQVDGLQAV